MIKNAFIFIGEYLLFLKQVFRRPEKGRLYVRQFILEADKLVMSSVFIVGVISFFIGGVTVIQTAANLQNPFIDKMYVGYMVRETLLLEFCSTLIAAVLAGKMGSNIASELGSMRITEQIDAMDMMGVNSAGFLVRPKILAATLLSPLLMFLSFLLGLLGAWVVVNLTGVIRVASFVEGIKYCYNGYYVVYSTFKLAVFSFIITSISSFCGYYATGGSLGVGRKSTMAIVISSVLILVFDFIITQLMLY